MRGIALFTFLLTGVLTPLVMLALRHLKVIDEPGERSSHLRTTLRGGGLAVFLGSTGGLILATVASVPDPLSLKTLIVCASVFALIGLLDDIRPMRARTRLITQVSTATIFVGSWLYNTMPVEQPWARLALAGMAVFWVVAFLNAFNFMDGINGISSLHAILAGTTFFWIGHVEHQRILQVCGVTVAASCLAFLPFNFPKARVFLGDVGSYFIGTWLGITVLISIEAGNPVEASIAPFLIYLADTGYTLLDRARRHERWYEAHREHRYQQLTALGWSHTLTAVVVTGFSVVCTALGLTSMTHSTALRLAADAAIVLVVVAYLALPGILRNTRPIVIDTTGLGALSPDVD